MCDLSELKKDVKKAYNLLPANCKKLAAKYQGVHPNYMRAIRDGEPLDKNTYIKALQSIEKASRQPIDKLLKNNLLIQSLVSKHSVKPKKVG